MLSSLSSLPLRAAACASLLFAVSGVCQAQFHQDNLVTDDQTFLTSINYTPAHFVDPNLVNPWGISFSATSPFWISDNGTGLSTLYRGDGSIVPLVVTVPPSPGGNPTGTVFNGTNDFHADRFLFVSEDGTISGWRGALGTNAETLVLGSSANVYKGLANGSANGNNYIYAANFKAGKIDVFDGSLNTALPGSFVDPNTPAGYAPFNIQNLGGKLYVAYAKQDNPANPHDEVAGLGKGFVDVFDTSGNFLMRLATGSDAGGGVTALDAPWGLALAPSNFGAFGGDLLVGNFGDGKINAFDPTSGALLGTLLDENGNPISIEGLWGLAFGTGGGANSGAADKLYFTAGIGDESHGLFGSLQAVPEPGSAALFLGAICMAGLVLRRRRA